MTGRKPQADTGASAHGPDVDPALIAEATRRIAESVSPIRILLFGSVARGDGKPDSDLDFLVVVADGTHRRETAQRLYRVLADLGCPKDIVVVTESDVATYGADPSLVMHSALTEGRELYRAA